MRMQTAPTLMDLIIVLAMMDTREMDSIAMVIKQLKMILEIKSICLITNFV
jgi:hypothetical protein